MTWIDELEALEKAAKGSALSSIEAAYRDYHCVLRNAAPRLIAIARAAADVVEGTWLADDEQTERMNALRRALESPHD